MQLIDSHCHLDFDYSPKTTADLVREAGQAGVGTLITIATDLASLEKVALISENHPQVFHTVGIHPHDTKTLDNEGMDLLRKAVIHPKCRAIGEIGLDYHYDHSPHDIQKTALELQLNLALETHLPVVIHSRDAESDLLEALTRYAKTAPANLPLGVIHCFTGTRTFGEACLALGFYISFSGILTFKNAAALQASAKAFPLDRLMIETDSPFLAPIPFRGKKCEPSMVKLTAQKLAELKNLPLEEVAHATAANTRRLFGLTVPQALV